MKALLLIGGGGHCRSSIDIIEAEGIYKIEGIVDRHEEKLEPVLKSVKVFLFSIKSAKFNFPVCIVRTWSLKSN